MPQTASIDRAVTALGLTWFEGSDSLDHPNAVFQCRDAPLRQGYRMTGDGRVIDDQKTDRRGSTSSPCD